MLSALPLLALVIAAYNLLVFVSLTPINGIAVALALPSGSLVALTTGDLLVSAGLVLLYVEIFKATRSGVGAILDHVLSVAVFIICLLQLLLLPAMATAPFAVLTLMTLIDVVAGFTVTISAARRDFAVDEGLR